MDYPKQLYISFKGKYGAEIWSKALGDCGYKITESKERFKPRMLTFNLDEKVCKFEYYHMIPRREENTKETFNYLKNYN
jgi:hypothetical protein